MLLYGVRGKARAGHLVIGQRDLFIFVAAFPVTFRIDCAIRPPPFVREWRLNFIL